MGELRFTGVFFIIVLVLVYWSECNGMVTRSILVLNVGGQFFHVLIGLPTNFGGRLRCTTKDLPYKPSYTDLDL